MSSERTEHPSSSNSHPTITIAPSSDGYHAYLRRSHGPIAPGTKSIPQGTPTCLANLTFVFTGELESISREDGQDAVKRCGGRVTGQPSGKTDYLVAGKEAGPAKMAKAGSLGIKILDEDGFLGLIEQRAREEEEETRKETPSKKRGASPSKRTSPAKKASSPVKKQTTPTKKVSQEKDTISTPDEDTSLWTVKYAPQSSADLVGNHAIFETLCNWLRTWRPSDEHHAALLSGPPGIGKTTMAHLAAKLNDMDIYELNASDTRNKQSLHVLYICKPFIFYRMN